MTATKKFSRIWESRKEEGGREGGDGGEEGEEGKEEEREEERKGG